MVPLSRRPAGGVALGGARRAARALTYVRSDHAQQVDTGEDATRGGDSAGRGRRAFSTILEGIIGSEADKAGE
jgi:hypothetical protein